MQKALFVASLLIVASLASVSTSHEEMTSLWSAWKSVHRRLYASNGEENARFAIFCDNYQKIIKFNAEDNTAKLGLNQFADLTAEEFQEQNSRCAFVDDDEEYVRQNTIEFTPAELANVPNSIDWRDQGVVTPVKNQRQCGSCWAFSTTGVLESFHAIKTSKLLTLSEQQIVDCDKTDYGCNGGWPYHALTYAANNGVELETDYPYVGRDQTCNYAKHKAISVNNGYSFVPPKDADALKAALAKSPVSVAIQADQSVFQFFKSGVITKNCGAGINHAVLAVGYTTINKVEAYIVKNSWDTTWGDQGYVYISTDGKANKKQGVCGILYQPVVAI